MNLHMRDFLILRIFRIHRQKIGIDTCNIFASSFLQHFFEYFESIPVPLKSVKLRRLVILTRHRTSKLTFPLFCIRALRCEVLFPGAAVASITSPPSPAGASTTAGMHEALSCRMSFPVK